MAIKIIGTTSGVEVDVDTTTKGLKCLNYSPDGYPLNPGTAVYMASLNSAISAAATPGAGSSLFHIRNPAASSKVLLIRKIRLNLFTLAAATTPQVVDLELIRTSGADMGGGTAITITKKDTSFATSVVTDCRHSTAMAALTVVGVSFGTQISTLLHASGALSRNEIVLDFDDNEGPILLRPGEGLAIRNITAIGAAMTWVLKGNIQWDERTPVV